LGNGWLECLDHGQVYHTALESDIDVTGTGGALRNGRNSVHARFRGCRVTEPARPALDERPPPPHAEQNGNDP
jgi:hypothetical protein